MKVSKYTYLLKDNRPTPPTPGVKVRAVRADRQNQGPITTERSQCSSLHSSKNTKHQVAVFSPRLSLGGSGCLQFAVDTHTRSKSPTRISREDSKVLYKCDDNTQVVSDPPSSLAIRPANPLNDVKDSLFVGLPNYGNSCYQNASLQSLMGLFPFLNDMISLLSCPVSSQSRTLCAVAKLMALRQKAVSTSISRHLNDLRDVFADIDPVFCSGEMQDANEFLLRLLDTINDEIDACRPSANPVRNLFQYLTSTTESYECTKCHDTALKQQENICYFISVPHCQGKDTFTLQDALELSMRPVRRELRCQHCHHNECHVTMKISKPPRILILQLNRYAFLGGEPKKIQTTMGIRKYLSLNTYVTDDALSPSGWIPTETQPCTASDFGELDPSGLSSAVSPPEPQTPQPAHPQCPLSVAVAKDAVAAPPPLAMTPATAQHWRTQPGGKGGATVMSSPRSFEWVRIQTTKPTYPYNLFSPRISST